MEGLLTDRRGLLVTAFGADPDRPGSDLRLRLWELAGQSGDVSVRLPTGLELSRAATADLRGRAIPDGSITVSNERELRVPLAAFRPTTVQLVPRRAGPPR